MKLLSILVITGYLISCNEEVETSHLFNLKNQSRVIEHRKKHYTEFETLNPVPNQVPEYGVAYFKRKKLQGDFDGDGQQEILYESLLSRKTGKRIDSLVFKNAYKGNYWPYDGQVDAICELDPILKLKCPERIADLQLNDHCQVFGIIDIINLGNINESPGDEIALMVHWADWSSMNSCDIFSYCSGEWKEVFSFFSRDWSLFETDQSKPDFSLILNYRDSSWRYLYQDKLGVEPAEWRKIKPCECPDGL